MGPFAGTDFLQALGWAVLNSLWQMAVLWTAYQLLSGTIVKKPSSRNLLATLLLTSGFAWFVFSFISLLRFNEPASVPGMTALVVNETVNDFFYAALPVASVIYLVFLVVPVLQYIRSYRYVRVIRSQGLQRAGAELRLFVDKVGARMGVRKDVQVWLSDLVASPVTIGYLKPIILLPVAALNQLSTSQVEAILLHELAHIRRFDYLVNLTVKMIQAILYFNPFVKAFAKIIESEREKTCDNLVLQFQYEPHAYASALLSLEKQARQVQLLTIPASGGRKNELLTRIESILGISRQERFSAGKLGRTLAGLGCGIVFLTVVLLSHPTRLSVLEGSMARYLSPFLVFPDGQENTELPGNQVLITGIAPEAVAAVHENPAPNEELADDQQEPIDQEEDEATQPMFASYHSGAAGAAAKQAEEQLSNEQVNQVKLAVQSARKVMEEIKWKDLEVSIADAMTLAQKEIARQAMQQEADKADWSKMEDRLKDSYSRINWPEINKNLSNAMVQMSYDSLQHVYNLALNSLATLEQSLDKTETKSIPDTDITLKAVQQKQADLILASEKLKKAKTKKIISL